MIKKYNQFVKTNENAPTPSRPSVTPETIPAPTETPSTPRPSRPSVIPTEEPGVKDNPLAYGDELDAVEGGLAGLAELLGTSVSGNVINYEGHKIDQPSETGKFRVDDIDLKTDDIEKVVAYLNNPEAQKEAQGKQQLFRYHLFSNQYHQL